MTFANFLLYGPVNRSWILEQSEYNTIAEEGAFSDVAGARGCGVPGMCQPTGSFKMERKQRERIDT
jgi:hypothetical protein